MKYMVVGERRAHHESKRASKLNQVVEDLQKLGDHSMFSEARRRLAVRKVSQWPRFVINRIIKRRMDPENLVRWAQEI